MISVSENQVIYVGDGQTTSFGFNFKILNRSDLHLTRVDKNGNETAVTSDYYIHMDTSIVDYPGYAPGAEEPEVDRPLVLARGEKLVIYRDVPITQESQMPTQWPFDVIEKAHDKSCMIDQQLQGQLDRSLKIARSNWTNNFDATIPVKAGYGWRVSDDGNSIIALANPEGIYDQCEGLKNEVVALKEATNVLKGQTQTAADNAIAAASSANNSKTSAQASATSAANSALDAGSKANIVEAYYTNVAEAYDEDEEYSAGDLVFVSNGDMYRALTDVSGEAPGSGYSWTKVQSNLMLTFEMDAAGDLMPRTAPQTSSIWDLDQNGDITPTAYGSGSETHGAEEQIIENQRNIAKLDATKADKTEIVDAYSKSEIDVQFATVNGDISELNGDIANRLEKNQGAENSGKYLTVAENGNVSPTELVLKTINNEPIVGSGNITVSGGGETWVDLGSGTLEEEANVITVNCNSGLKKFELIAKSPSNITANIMRMAYQRNGWSWITVDDAYCASNTEFARLFIRWERIYEKECLVAFITTTGANHISTNTILIKGSISDFNFELLQKIGVQNNGKFPVGTTFKARGVY